MSKVTLTANIAKPDDFYAELIEAHDGLTKPESDALNARLVLTLANHIGDREVLSDAIRAARAAARA